jgi:HEAT repeat protein
MVKFCCDHCGHKLKASPDRAGQRCKCPRCGQALTVPSSPPPVPAAPAQAPAASPASGPVNKKSRRTLALGVSVAVGLLGIAGLVVFLLHPRDVDRKLSDLKGGDPEARRQALLWLAGADVDGPHRVPVTAALEPLLFEGDVRGDLRPDLVLRAYLHWAGPDNVPALVRLVQSTSIPDWSSQKAGLVMQALGKLQDPRAADVLAEKLGDPALHEQAVDALRLTGPAAEGAVLDYAFDDNADTRLRANQLLAEYGTKPRKVVGEALARLRSSSPDAQRSAAVWLAESPPDDERQQAEVSKALTGLLADLSPKVNALALHALRLWATKDCLPQLVAFARRDEKAGACPPELIDVLARFPDAGAAEAVALQLKVPANRAQAVQGLAKMGSAATKAVLRYLDYPDPAIQKEVRWLCEQLGTPAAAQLDQTLADVAAPQKPRARAALQALGGLRPDEASRAKVSAALNTPLLDPDPGVRDAALNAARVWVSPANTATLLKLLGQLRTGPVCDPRVIELLGALQDPAATTALAGGLTRPQPELDANVKALVAQGPGAEEAVIPYLQSADRAARYAACWVLGEIGTSKSVAPLEAAGNKYTRDDDFYRRTKLARQMILARQ